MGYCYCCSAFFGLVQSFLHNGLALSIQGRGRLNIRSSKKGFIILILIISWRMRQSALVCTFLGGKQLDAPSRGRIFGLWTRARTNYDSPTSSKHRILGLRIRVRAMTEPLTSSKRRILGLRARAQATASSHSPHLEVGFSDSG